LHSGQATNADLKRLAKRWPPSLWLFSASGALTVMRYPEGERNAAHTNSGGVDPDFIVDTIHGIDNDGGDW
jgi:acyl-CoA synthetase (NDP forming)